MPKKYYLCGMKKRVLDCVVLENRLMSTEISLLRLTSSESFPFGVAGQFVMLRIDGGGILLRRPFSIHGIDYAKNELHLLIRAAGAGTRWLRGVVPGDVINIMLPLGHGFTIPERSTLPLLLIGGGVGVAPLLYLGEQLVGRGITPIFLLGARTSEGIVRYEEFRRLGEVHISTEDGSMGERGYVTDHSVLRGDFGFIYACGPLPMLRSVASYASNRGIGCEVSLENRMACGLGACLCCVERTLSGHVCVCTEGPVFNIDQLSWRS
jgi:dihydroorotate dehydrogenase electron transfer subunit